MEFNPEKCALMHFLRSKLCSVNGIYPMSVDVSRYVGVRPLLEELSKSGEFVK